MLLYYLIFLSNISWIKREVTRTSHAYLHIVDCPASILCSLHVTMLLVLFVLISHCSHLHGQLNLLQDIFSVIGEQLVIMRLEYNNSLLISN